ncbi:MAG: helix-turn-helix transcriptional regulator [Eubacteriales bacterium]|nr:helix-turn-helix transcriptional regulator [Eubacteriales bacterium]
MNKLYTAQEVADKLKIKKTTVYELIKRGELNSSKIGKQLRVSEEQLSQYLNSSQQRARESGLHLPDSQPESSMLKRDYLLHSSGLILSGQTSPALELLQSQMAVHPDGLPILQSHMNSYNGLYALYFQKAHIASASLDRDTIRKLVPGISLEAVCLYEYPIGLYVQKGNPKNITALTDLTRADVILANREKGSTRRIFLDEKLKHLGISPEEISGYHNELVSDLSTAAAVAGHKADAAVGEEYVARQSQCLSFLPLETLPMYLVAETSSMGKPGFSALLEIVCSEDFKTSLRNQTGYDISHTGECIRL